MVTSYEKTLDFGGFWGAARRGGAAARFFQEKFSSAFGEKTSQEAIIDHINMGCILFLLKLRLFFSHPLGPHCSVRALSEFFGLRDCRNQ